MASAVLELVPEVTPVVLTEREREVLLLGWESGFAYRDRLTAEAAMELRTTPIAPVPTRAEAVARRRADLDWYAAAAYAREGRREWLGLDRGGWAP